MRRSLPALALGAALALAAGCAGRPAATTVPSAGDRAPATATVPGSADATLQPHLDATRDLVWRYVIDAQAGNRTAMLDAYLPDTRRSAETVVVRDIELARPQGPLAAGLKGTSSVFLSNGGLMPPRAGAKVHAEDAARLKELAASHELALMVLIELRDGSERPVFLVREDGRWWMLP